MRSCCRVGKRSTAAPPTSPGAGEAGPLEVARHLLAAARFDEAVPACIAAAEEAEASLAFAEAVELLEQALPHVRDRVTRARLLCRMGRVLWMDGKTAAAEAVLDEGVPGLEPAGETLEAARHRLVGRCRCERSRPREATRRTRAWRGRRPAAGPHDGRRARPRW
jgi:hypothetical protein